MANDSEHCARKDNAANGTQVGMPNFHFSGIPETLIINSVIAFILVLIFIALKKSAWAFKRLRVKGEAGKFAAIFYGPPSDPPRSPDDSQDGSDDGGGAREEQELIKEGSGALSWIGVAAFKLKDRHFRRRCGQDAVEYLYFQRLLITILAISSVATLAILLPIDVIFGTLLWVPDMDDYYGLTTLSNIDASTYWVLFHIGLTILLFPLVVILVRRVLRIRLKNKIQDDRQWARYRTLMISNVTTIDPDSGEVIDENLIRRHFDEAYPKVSIDAVDFTYDTAALREVIDEKRRLDFCLDFYAARKQQFGPEHHKSTIRPVKCKVCCGACRGEEVDGEEFYRHECDAITKKMKRKYEKLERSPTNVIFVTFESHEQAEHVNRDFNWGERVCCCGLCTRRTPRESSVAEKLGVNVWGARYAPLPRFVNWRNLSYGGWLWWLRTIAINFVIFWIAFFLSTPPLVLNFLSDKVGFLMKIPIFSQWLPTIILLGVPILLPIVILMSVQWIGYYSLVTQLNYQLRNLFLFLLLTLVILPGVGMTSADAVFQWLSKQIINDPTKNSTQGGEMQWECVFIPSSGAFFVNFIIGLALLGNALDLLRIGPLVWFEIQRLAFARTEAERTWINLQRAEFPYASHYATMLIVYSIAVVYGFICPLVMPFALFYMCVKRVIDKYNIFFASSRNTFETMNGGESEDPSKLSSGMHITATRYLFFALFIQQFVLTFFAIIRRVPVLAYVIILVCTVATGVFLVYEFWFADYVDPELIEAYHEQLDKDDLKYSPPVLQEYRRLMSPTSGRNSRNSAAGENNKQGYQQMNEENGRSPKGSRGKSSSSAPTQRTPPAAGDDYHQMNQAIAMQMQPTTA